LLYIIKEKSEVLLKEFIMKWIPYYKMEI